MTKKDVDFINDHKLHHPIPIPTKHIGGSDFDGDISINTESLDYVNDNVIEFSKILNEALILYSRKNRDYGNSFDESLDEDGLLVAKIRMGDKLRRFNNLIKNDSFMISDESIEDTLIDLANYANMTVKWIRSQREEDVE